jgi:hypothetical protein
MVATKELHDTLADGYRSMAEENRNIASSTWLSLKTLK